MTMDPQGAPHDSAATASVGAGMVRLFDPDGEAFDVPASRVDYWLGRGMSRERFSIEDAADGLPHLFDAAKRAWTAYVRAVQKDAQIDASPEGERATALVAIDVLLQTIGRIEWVNASLPVTEGEAVIITQWDPLTQRDIEHRVDPRQAQHYQRRLGGEIVSGTPHEEQADVDRSYLDAELASAEQAIADGEAAITEHRAKMARTRLGAPTPFAPAMLSSATLDQRERELQRWRERRAELRRAKEGGQR